jgi:hypothetical protein
MSETQNMCAGGLACHSSLEQCPVESSTVECIISQSINLLKQEKKHQTLISIRNELIRVLIQLIPSYIPILVCKCLCSKKGFEQQSWAEGSSSLSPVSQCN